MRKEKTFRDKFIKKNKKVNKSHTTDVVWWTQRAHTLVRERVQTYKITCVPWYGNNNMPKEFMTALQQKKNRVRHFSRTRFYRSR